MKKILYGIFVVLMSTCLTFGCCFVAGSAIQTSTEIAEVEDDEQTSTTATPSGNWLDNAGDKWHGSVSNGVITYRIYSAEEFARLARNVNSVNYYYAEDSSGNKCYFYNAEVYLMNNIDLSAHYWTPINYFRGNFYGNNHTISGLYVSNTNSSIQYTGLFGCLGYSGTSTTIRDLSIVSGDVSTDMLGNTYVGAVAGGVYTGASEVKFENVHNLGCSVKVTYSDAGTDVESCVGGICGTASYNTTFSNCSNHASVRWKRNGHSATKVNIGGILGRYNLSFEGFKNVYNSEQKTIFENCYNGGDVNVSIGSSATSYNFNMFGMGGIVGVMWSRYTQNKDPIIFNDIISNSVNTGDIRFTIDYPYPNHLYPQLSYDVTKWYSGAGGIMGVGLWENDQIYGAYGTIRINGCANYGRIYFQRVGVSYLSSTPGLGGIAGSVGRNSGVKLEVNDCANFGNVSLGSIMTYLTTEDSIKNSTGGYGGIVGFSGSDTNRLLATVKYCVNYGDVERPRDDSSPIGTIVGSGKVENCIGYRQNLFGLGSAKSSYNNIETDASLITLQSKLGSTNVSNTINRSKKWFRSDYALELYDYTDNGAESTDYYYIYLVPMALIREVTVEVELPSGSDNPTANFVLNGYTQDGADDSADIDYGSTKDYASRKLPFLIGTKNAQVSSCTAKYGVTADKDETTGTSYALNLDKTTINGKNYSTFKNTDLKNFGILQTGSSAYVGTLYGQLEDFSVKFAFKREKTEITEIKVFMDLNDDGEFVEDENVSSDFSTYGILKVGSTTIKNATSISSDSPLTVYLSNDKFAVTATPNIGYNVSFYSDFKNVRNTSASVSYSYEVNVIYIYFSYEKISVDSIVFKLRSFDGKNYKYDDVTTPSDVGTVEFTNTASGTTVVPEGGKYSLIRLKTSLTITPKLGYALVGVKSNLVEDGKYDVLNNTNIDEANAVNLGEITKSYTASAPLNSSINALTFVFKKIDYKIWFRGYADSSDSAKIANRGSKDPLNLDATLDLFGVGKDEGGGFTDISHNYGYSWEFYHFFETADTVVAEGKTTSPVDGKTYYKKLDEKYVECVELKEFETSTTYYERKKIYSYEDVPLESTIDSNGNKKDFYLSYCNVDFSTLLLNYIQPSIDVDTFDLYMKQVLSSYNVTFGDYYNTVSTAGEISAYTSGTTGGTTSVKSAYGTEKRISIGGGTLIGAEDKIETEPKLDPYSTKILDTIDASASAGYYLRGISLKSGDFASTDTNFLTSNYANLLSGFYETKVAESDLENGFGENPVEREINLYNYYSVAKFGFGFGMIKDGTTISYSPTKYVQLTYEGSPNNIINETALYCTANLKLNLNDVVDGTRFVGWYLDDGELAGGKLLSTSSEYTFAYSPSGLVSGLLNGAESPSDDGFGWTTSTSPYSQISRIIVAKFETLTTGTTANQTGRIYEVSTYEQLVWLSNQVNDGNNFAGCIIRQTADIDMEHNAFVPIGTETNPFKGVYDGQNYFIKNLSINFDEFSNVGLFGYTDGATIKNLTILSGSVVGYANVGAVVGCAKNTTFTNVNNYGCEVKAGTESFYDIYGELLTGTQSAGALTKENFAGLVGYADGCSFVGCSNQSNSVSGNANVAGLVGYANGGTIDQCYTIRSLVLANNTDGSCTKTNYFDSTGIHKTNSSLWIEIGTGNWVLKIFYW